MPALLKMTSSLPKTSTARCTAASTWLYTDTSTWAAAANPGLPSPSISATTFSACSRLMSATTTLAPSRTNEWTVARPMPLAPPVMSATLPCKRMMLPSAEVDRGQRSGSGGLAPTPTARCVESAQLVRRCDGRRVGRVDDGDVHRFELLGRKLAVLVEGGQILDHHVEDLRPRLVDGCQEGAAGLDLGDGLARGVAPGHLRLRTGLGDGLGGTQCRVVPADPDGVESVRMSAEVVLDQGQRFGAAGGRGLDLLHVAAGDVRSRGLEVLERQARAQPDAGVRIMADDHDVLALQPTEGRIELLQRAFHDALLVRGDVDGERIARFGRSVHGEHRDVRVLRGGDDGSDRRHIGVPVEDRVGTLADRALNLGIHLLEVEVPLDHGQVPAELLGLGSH